MTSEFIGLANNCIPPTDIHSNENIAFKFCKLIKNILGHVWLVF